jgi:hypothetical protein
MQINCCIKNKLRNLLKEHIKYWVVTNFIYGLFCQKISHV